MIYATAKSTNTSTKCAKMQKEEQQRKDALNGNGDCGPPTAEREEPPRSAYSHGGRLKFFKDGKFILELERAREGERVSWVSVPRKTFWPPQGTASSTPSYRQESSTSLSDDNSSIQSSPWQRDHSWKQTTPRRNLSKELAFYYQRPTDIRLGKSKKRRKPHDPSPEFFACKVEGPVRVKTEPKKQAQCNKKPTLLSVVQSLLDKLSMGSPPRAETVVSPRKRFLREMERDGKAPTEDACQKRSRSKPTVKVESSPVRLNGATEEPRLTSRNSSYSITSLLADDRSKKSPANSPSHFSTGPIGYCPPPPTSEDRWYTESVDRLRSIELSHPDKRLYSPYQAPYMAPYIYPYQIPPHYYHPGYARGYPNVTSVYPMQLPIRPEAPSCSWAADPTRDSEHRDENIADMPLNLSKHAG